MGRAAQQLQQEREPSLTTLGPAQALPRNGIQQVNPTSYQHRSAALGSIQEAALCCKHNNRPIVSIVMSHSDESSRCVHNNMGDRVMVRIELSSFKDNAVSIIKKRFDVNNLF